MGAPLKLSKTKHKTLSLTRRYSSIHSKWVKWRRYYRIKMRRDVFCSSYFSCRIRKWGMKLIRWTFKKTDPKINYNFRELRQNGRYAVAVISGYTLSRIRTCNFILQIDSSNGQQPYLPKKSIHCLVAILFHRTFFADKVGKNAKGSILKNLFI